jgi:hypothetical protein
MIGYLENSKKTQTEVKTSGSILEKKLGKTGISEKKTIW